MMVETITCNYPVWCKVNSAFLGPFQQVGLAGDIAEGQLNILALSQNTNERKKNIYANQHKYDDTNGSTQQVLE